MDMDDRWAITDTLSRVGHVFDDGRLEEIGTVFTDDVVYDMSALGMPVIHGVDGARAAAGAILENGPVAHFVANVVIADHGGDNAAVDSKGLMLMRDGSLTAVVHHDVLRHERGGWRIAERRILPAGA